MRAIKITCLALLVLSATPAKASLVTYGINPSYDLFFYGMGIEGTLAPHATATFQSIIPTDWTGGNGWQARIRTLAPDTVTDLPFTLSSNIIEYRFPNPWGAPASHTVASASYYYDEGSKTLSPSIAPLSVLIGIDQIDPHHVNITFTNINDLAAMFSVAASQIGAFVQFVSAAPLSNVPLPAALPLLGMATAGLAAIRRLRAKNKSSCKTF